MRGAAYRQMTPDLPKEGKITYAKTLAEAVRDADLIQESVPERLDIKHKVLAEIDAHAKPDALIGSSTSGIKPTRYADVDDSGRNGWWSRHPFNPVYLLPIVEIVGGKKTTKEFTEKARALYASIGMKPVVIQKEIEAFVGDRLLEAVWREALWLIKDGITTVEELDDIMRYGFGIRWAQMGMFQVYRIAGGEAGMRHFMAQFGPCLKWPWTKLTDVPEFNDELVDLIAGQSDEQSGKWSIRELEAIRDENLVAIMAALSKTNKGKGWGAGELHKDYVKQVGEEGWRFGLLRRRPRRTSLVKKKAEAMDFGLTEEQQASSSTRRARLSRTNSIRMRRRSSAPAFARWN